MRMRLQKFMADAGVDSRRKCEELIVRGLVQVNGERAELGRVVDPAQDVVTYAGRRLCIEQKRLVWVVYKPQCVVSTMPDRQGRASVAVYF